MTTPGTPDQAPSAAERAQATWGTAGDPEPPHGTVAWDRWSARRARTAEVAAEHLAAARAALEAGRADLTTQRLKGRNTTEAEGQT